MTEKLANLDSDNSRCPPFTASLRFPFTLSSTSTHSTVKVKIKQSLSRPGQTLRVPEG